MIIIEFLLQTLDESSSSSSSSSSTRRRLAWHTNALDDSADMQQDEISAYEDEPMQFEKTMQICLSTAFVVIFLLVVGLSIFGKRVVHTRPPRNSPRHNADRQQGGGEDGPPLSRRELRRIAREERKKYIERTLVVKHVVVYQRPTAAAEIEDLESSPRSSSNSTLEYGGDHDQRLAEPIPIQRPKSNLFLSSPDDSEASIDSSREPWICAICLAPYEDGDEICWSQNPECNHVFHHQCIEHWLYKHDDCPMCRAVFISMGGDEDEKEHPSNDAVANAGGCHILVPTEEESPVRLNYLAAEGDENDNLVGMENHQSSIGEEMEELSVDDPARGDEADDDDDDEEEAIVVVVDVESPAATSPVFNADEQLAELAAITSEGGSTATSTAIQAAA